MAMGSSCRVRDSILQYVNTTNMYPLQWCHLPPNHALIPFFVHFNMERILVRVICWQLTAMSDPTSPFLHLSVSPPLLFSIESDTNLPTIVFDTANRLK